MQDVALAVPQATSAVEPAPAIALPTIKFLLSIIGLLFINLQDGSDNSPIV